MRSHSKKFYIFLVTGILCFTFLPAFLHCLTLNEMGLRSHTSFKRFDLDNSIVNSVAPERECSLGYLPDEAKIKVLIYVEEIFCIYSQVPQPHFSAFILRC